MLDIDYFCSVGPTDKALSSQKVYLHPYIGSWVLSNILQHIYALFCDVRCSSYIGPVSDYVLITSTTIGLGRLGGWG